MISPRPIPPRALTLSLLACAVAFVATGCNAPGKPGPEPEVPRPEQVLDFATLYSQNCAACHGENGRNGAAIALANPVYLAIAGSANIQRITADGVPGTAMPPFAKSKGGMLTDQQIAILAQGMQQHWGNPGALAGTTPPPYAAAAPGNPAQGQQAFTTFCARCHGADGTGVQAGNDFVTGSLVDPAYLALISDQGLRSFILASEIGHADVNAQYLHPTLHDWRSYSASPSAPAIPIPMSDQQVADTVAWLASHRIATPGQVYHEHP
jgi:cytochrome c oxidase cbb3-type subunit 3/ubiquinol-cytochrome c reductase cytochrome c subunit